MAHSSTGVIQHPMWGSPGLRYDERMQSKGPVFAHTFGQAAPQPYYLMLGLDTACDPPSMITWTVRGLPDLDGLQIPEDAYSCGTVPADITGIRVLATWGVPEIVTTEPASLEEGDGYLVVTDDGEMTVFS